MKQPERVAELLAELRALTENDFERQHIDVLEKDLTTPPTVEVIDDKHQRFNGVTYRKNKDGHFYYGLAIHRAVWSYSHGEIPAKHEIHHVNHDKSDNSASNLQLLTNFAHQQIHHLKPPIERVCPICGKKFVLKRRDSDTVCCSYDCGIKWRGREKKPVEKTCPVCGKIFTAPHWSQKIFCSNTCSGKAKATKIKCPVVEITCAHCGKIFSVPSYAKQKKYCSAQCYHESRRGSKKKS